MKNDNNKNVIGAVVAGVTGIAAIAGVAVAATMAMKDEKTRKKVRSALVKAKDEAIEFVDRFKTKPEAKRKAKPIKKIALDIKNTVKKISRRKP